MSVPLQNPMATLMNVQRPMSMLQPFMRPFPSAFPFQPGQVLPVNHAISDERDYKKERFAKGVFVSGFQKTMTRTSLLEHFNKVKTSIGNKIPSTKFNEKKGFAFIYFHSPADAEKVQKELDRTVILKNEIRVSKIVSPEYISKMMIKIKTTGKQKEQITKIHTDFFNQRNLESETQRIVQNKYGKTVQVNKIAIPVSNGKPLDYTRVFFFINNLTEAEKITTRATGDPMAVSQSKKKEKFQMVLTDIVDILNKDSVFSQYCRAQIYEYSKRNKINTIHIKGLKRTNETVKLSNDLSAYISKFNEQWNIRSVYCAIHPFLGGWANVSFSNEIETEQAFAALKRAKEPFDGRIIYASIKNIKDYRTVVISQVLPDVTEQQVSIFLTGLAKNSPINEKKEEMEASGHKYDFFSFNICEKKYFFRTDEEENKAILSKDYQSTIKENPSWREMNEVPRRLIVNFFEQITNEEIRVLRSAMQSEPDFKNIFSISSTQTIRIAHQKGHINNDNMYVKHIEIKPKGGRKDNGPRQERNLRPHQGHQNTRPGHKLTSQIDYSKIKDLGLGGDMMKNTKNMQNEALRSMPMRSNIPPRPPNFRPMPPNMPPQMAPPFHQMAPPLGYPAPMTQSKPFGPPSSIGVAQQMQGMNPMRAHMPPPPGVGIPPPPSVLGMAPQPPNISMPPPPPGIGIMQPPFFNRPIPQFGINPPQNIPPMIPPSDGKYVPKPPNNEQPK